MSSDFRFLTPLWCVQNDNLEGAVQVDLVESSSRVTENVPIFGAKRFVYH